MTTPTAEELELGQVETIVDSATNDMEQGTDAEGAEAKLEVRSSTTLTAGQDQKEVVDADDAAAAADDDDDDDVGDDGDHDEVKASEEPDSAAADEEATAKDVDEAEGAEEEEVRVHMDHLKQAAKDQTVRSLGRMGPEQSGDVVVFLGEVSDEQRANFASTVRGTLGLRARGYDLSKLKEFAQDEAKQRGCCEGSCECLSCIACLLPKCITQHGLSTSDFSWAFFISADSEELSNSEEPVFLSAAERSHLLLDRMHYFDTPQGKEEFGVAMIATLHDANFMAWHWSGKGYVGTEVDPDVPSNCFSRFLVNCRHWFNGYRIQPRCHPDTQRQLQRDVPSGLWKRVPNSRNFVHDLRAQYGEKVAWLFAYHHFFIQCLYVPAVCGLIVLFINNPIVHMLYGLCMSVVFPSVFKALWIRRRNEYRYLWGTEPPRIVHDREYDDKTHATKSSCKSTSVAHLVTLVRYLCVIACYIVWIFVMCKFVEFYVVLRANNVDPAWTVFNITKDAVHGIAMMGLGNAIFKGMAAALIACENFDTETKREEAMVKTFFALDFWNFFVGLLLQAFIFQPLREGGVLGWEVSSSAPDSYLNGIFSYWWQSEIDVDTASERMALEQFHLLLIGPVAVARVFIFIFLSLLPWLLQRRRRAGLSVKFNEGMDKATAGLVAGVNVVGSGVKGATEHVGKAGMAVGKAGTGILKNVAKITYGLNPGKQLTKLKKAELDDETIVAEDEGVEEEVELTVELTERETVCLIKLQCLIRTFLARGEYRRKKRALMSLDNLVEEVGLEPYQPILFHNDLSLQYGLVCFFSQVAPFIPAAILLFATGELRLRVGTLMYGSRRPHPHKSQGLGAWFSALNFIGNMAMVVGPLVSMVSVNHFNSLWDCAPGTERLYVSRRMQHIMLSVMRFKDYGQVTFPQEEGCVSDTTLGLTLLCVLIVGYLVKVLIESCIGATPTWLRFTEMDNETR